MDNNISAWIAKAGREAFERADWEYASAKNLPKNRAAGKGGWQSWKDWQGGWQSWQGWQRQPGGWGAEGWVSGDWGRQ